MKFFEGLIAAPFAPMHESGELNYEIIPGYCQFLDKNRISGIFINGSTGEGVSLTQNEKVKTTEAWTAAARNTNLRVINLVSGTSHAECSEMAQMSQTIGVDAIAIIAPYYFKPAGARQLAEYCAKIAESVPNLPVYFYHIPVLTGVNIAMNDFLQEATAIIPNLVGIKYTHEDFMDFLSCLNFNNGKYEILAGRDENLLSALVLGARGAVGSTFNYAAPLYLALIDAYDRGDHALARALQQKANDMIRLLPKYGGIGTGKAFMRHIGFEFGHFRSPVKNIDKSQYKAFEADVELLNMNEWFSVK